MIQSFKCADTETFFAGKRVARFANMAAVAMRKLQQLHAATALAFLRIPPGNRLEALSGDGAGSTAFASTTSGRCVFLG